jgi:large subunit ribosomal protein L6
MTIAGKIENIIAVPEGVTVTREDDVVTVRGPKGELSRSFAHPRVIVEAREGEVAVWCEYPRVKEKAMVGTFTAHVNNMIKGVTTGFSYGLKVVYSHFPMKVTAKGDRVEINNYMGGHAVRSAKVVGKCKVTVSGADVTVEGISIEDCGQTAANIERATSRTGFDKRTFQDGIYIVHKSHKVKE